MRIFRMMNYVSDWCPYIFGMSSFWYFDVFFGAEALIKSICLRVGIGNQNWMDHSHHSGKVRNWWEYWQVYVTDVEFTRDGTVPVYIEKCRDWFGTYHYVVLAFSTAATVVVCTFSAPKGPWNKAGESCWRSWYIYVARAIVCLGGEPEADLGKLQVGSPETLTRKLWWQVGSDRPACNDHRWIRLDEVI